MNISAVAIRNPVAVMMIFALLALSGLLAYRSTPIQDFPDIELPMVTVSAVLEGAAPEQLETEVARKIEDSIATIQGVKHIITQVRDSEVSILVEFILEKNSSDALDEVRDSVSRIRADLPGDLKEPVIAKASTAGRVVQTFVVSSDDLDEQEVSWFVDDKVTKRLLSVSGVGAVKRIGGVSREIQVEFITSRMAALGITSADISKRIREVQQDAAGGRGDIGGEQQSVRTVASIKSAKELAELDLPLNDGRRVRLSDVAKISDTVSEPKSVALFNGSRVVGVEVFRSRGASEIDVANGARAAIQKLAADYPRIQIREAINNSAPIEENFRGSMNLLYEGAVLAVLVVWAFLRDGRATFIAAAALPLSVIPAFLGMAYFGFSLNTVTLLSLALVVGILVDDAIVEIENIARHLQMGKSPYDAAIEAAEEIGLAVIATTFALVAVFLPTAFMGGIPGKFFKQFGWTAVVAILASLIVARLLTPLMCAYLLKAKPERHQEDGWVMCSYMKAVAWCLNHRRKTVLAAIGFFVLSIALVGLLPTGFVPPSDKAQTLVNIELAPGSTLSETIEAEARVRSAIASISDVKAIYSSIGGGSSGDVFAAGTAAEVRRAILTVALSHRDDRSDSIQEIESKIRAQLASIPGVRFKIGAQDNGVKMQIVLKGNDSTSLVEASRKAERELRTLSGIGTVSSGASLTRPEIMVRPDIARAADLGVTTEMIGKAVRVATAGDYETSLAKLNVGDRLVPVRAKLPDEDRSDLERLKRLPIQGSSGPVMLASVATVSLESGPAQIDRLDRVRNVTLEIELGSRPLGEVYKEALNLPSLKNLPPGVSIAELGDTQEMKNLFASFGMAMTIGILCIYGVLVLLFKDFMQPLTILTALPLSIGGAFVGLLITGNALSMPAMIGLLMLMGVVTKNSILLVEYAIVARNSGMSRYQALVDACHKRSRPIVMTTIAMGAGMLPMAMGLGANAGFRSPMAIAVVGGLITSTALSLLVVPVVFTYVDDLQQRIHGLLSRRFGSEIPAVVPEQNF